MVTSRNSKPATILPAVPESRHTMLDQLRHLPVKALNADWYFDEKTLITSVVKVRDLHSVVVKYTINHNFTFGLKVVAQNFTDLWGPAPIQVKSPAPWDAWPIQISETEYLVVMCCAFSILFEVVSLDKDPRFELSKAATHKAEEIITLISEVFSKKIC